MNEIESSIEELSSNDDPQLIALELINQIQDLLFGLFRPWNAYQLAIALIVFLIATLLSISFGTNCALGCRLAKPGQSGERP